MRKILGLSAIVALAGCVSMEAPVLPASFTTKDGAYNAQYIDKARFEFPAPNVESFTDRVARCGVSNLSIDSFIAKDTSKSWVGPATGRLYQSGNRSTVAGGEVLKYSSEAEGVVILAGREQYGENNMGVIGVLGDPTGDTFKKQLDFDIEIAKSGATYSMVFSNMKRAQQSTGSLENNGFTPIGVWKGSQADEIVPIIERTASTLNDCIQS